MGDVVGSAVDDAPLGAAAASGRGLGPRRRWSEVSDEACSDDYGSALRRLQVDLDANPGSPTLCDLALCDPAGRVIGMAPQGSALEASYTGGAPVAAIVFTEALIAFVGERGDRGYQRRAVRLAHLVRAANRRLGRHSGLGRALPEVTVLGQSWSPERRVDALRLALTAAQLDADRAARSPAVANAPPGAGSDPPPLDSAVAAPLLRTGPPLGCTRAAA